MNRKNPFVQELYKAFRQVEDMRKNDDNESPEQRKAYGWRGMGEVEKTKKILE